LRTSGCEDPAVRTRTVLHVLPHPGGGGETYVDSLAHMHDYQHERIFLAAGRAPLRAAPSLLSSVPRVNLAARRFDIVHVHGEVASCLCLPALASRPSVLTLHGLNLVKRSSRLVRPVAALNLRIIVGAATRTICVSAAERDEVLQVVGKASAVKLAVVLNGVEPPTTTHADERASIRAELGVEDRVVALAVGALDTPKDPLTLVYAAIASARAGSPVALLLVGNGSLRGRLEEISRGSNGVVQVLGQRNDVARLLVAADLFALSSSHEGLPYALLEAMAAGLPCVVSDYPGVAEVVGDAALVVPHQNVDGFHSAIEQLAADASLRATLGERARRRVESRFSLDSMLEETRRVYDEVIVDNGETLLPGGR
jgi:glycosyltransferase involved in cell wall biosynthesis